MPSLASAVPQIERRVRLLLDRLPRGLAAFLCVGMGGLAVDIVVLGLLERLGLDKALARLASLGVATVFTWLMNRLFTFGGSGRRSEAEFGRYALVAMMAQSVNYLVFLGLSDLFPHLPHALTAIFGAVAATGFSYTGQRFFTFARAKAEADA